MNQSVFLERDFILLILFSVIIPAGIYGFMITKYSISRWTVVGFSILLMIVSGIDVVLLQSLAEEAKASESLIDDKLFLGQLSIALYLIPAIFAGLAVNLFSHVLVNHLNEAENKFDNAKRSSQAHDTARIPHWYTGVSIFGAPKENIVLFGSAITIAIIFFLDLKTGADIRLHVLYIFPVAMIARHCKQIEVVIAILSVTTLLQVITFSEEALAVWPFFTDIFVATLASLMVVFLARTSRNMYIMAVNQAETDSLTGIANRRLFIARLDSEIARQKRYGGIFTLSILDLDGFKVLNDTKGHPAGDEALKLAAEILLGGTRESDLVARIGGDEFAILMPNMLARV